MPYFTVACGIEPHDDSVLGRQSNARGNVRSMKLEEKEILRKKRHRRVRAKVNGTQERPRLNVSRSLQHI